MSDLKLVAPDQPTPLEQRLLDAVANESPSAEQRLRVRLAMGLPAVAPVPAPALPPAVGQRALLLKAAAGVVVVSAAAVALWLSGVGRSAPRVEQPVTPVAVQPAPTVPTVAAQEVAAPATPEPAARVPGDSPAKRAGKARPSNASSSAPSVESGADLSEQLRLIEAARSAVAARNASGASAALSSYRSRFPRGAFGQEATVLQIETLDLQGNHALASAQARSFLARHPNSPHVNVVQRIAGR